MQSKISKFICIIGLALLLLCCFTNINYATSFDPQDIPVEINNSTTIKKSTFNVDDIDTNSFTISENEKHENLNNTLYITLITTAYILAAIIISSIIGIIVFGLKYITIKILLHRKNNTEDKNKNLKEKLEKTRKKLVVSLIVFVVFLFIDMIRASSIRYSRPHISITEKMTK